MRALLSRLLATTAVPLVAACQDVTWGGQAGFVGVDVDLLHDTGFAPADQADWGGDLLAMDLDLDLLRRTGQVHVDMVPPDSGVASFWVGGLAVDAVRWGPNPVPFLVVGHRLDVQVPAGGAFTVDYGFDVQGPGSGYVPGGATAVLPQTCDNLLPCRRDPADAMDLAVSLWGLPPEAVVVVPPPSTGPAWQLGWAMGDYHRHALGTTAAGTDVVSYTLPGDVVEELMGTAGLAAGIDWLEARLGPYPLGDELGPVEVDWGGKRWGGLDTAPLWQVDTAAFRFPGLHLDLAAQGWLGHDVRPRCWEERVLTEGPARYMAARALEQQDPVAAARLWADLRLTIVLAAGTEIDRPVWAEGCGIQGPDALDDALVAAKGAWFLRALGEEAGMERVDAAIGAFARDHAGRAVGMDALLHDLHKGTGVDPRPLAAVWLRDTGAPDRIWGGPGDPPPPSPGPGGQ